MCSETFACQGLITQPLYIAVCPIIVYCLGLFPVVLQELHCYLNLYVTQGDIGIMQVGQHHSHTFRKSTGNIHSVWNQSRQKGTYSQNMRVLKNDLKWTTVCKIVKVHFHAILHLIVFSVDQGIPITLQSSEMKLCVLIDIYIMTMEQESCISVNNVVLLNQH